jgi:hypothetical protein
MSLVSLSKDGCARQETDETLREQGVFRGESLSGLGHRTDYRRSCQVCRTVQRQEGAA